MRGTVFSRSCGPTREGAQKAVCWLPEEIPKAQASSRGTLQPEAYSRAGRKDDGKAREKRVEAPQKTGGTRHPLRLPRICTLI